MSYTQEDLAAIQSAIIKLGVGDRVVEVNFSDGHSAKYAETSLASLKALRAGIQRELSTGRRFIPTVTRKGL